MVVGYAALDFPTRNVHREERESVSVEGAEYVLDRKSIIFREHLDVAWVPEMENQMTATILACAVCFLVGIAIGVIIT